MKTPSMLFAASLLVACGGSNAAQEPVAPVAPAAEPMPSSEPTADMAAEPTAPAEPAAAPAEPTPPPMPRATVELKAIPGDAVVGSMTFEQQDKQIVISGSFTGLKKGDKALYIHENGDCGNGGKAAGGHFNPSKSKHGGLGSAVRHSGDFGNITVDEAGAASFATSTDSITIGGADDINSVVGKAVVVHAKKDDKKGNAGAAIACGVIALQ